MNFIIPAGSGERLRLWISGLECTIFVGFWAFPKPPSEVY